VSKRDNQIFIVEDDAAVRAHLSGLISQTEGLELLGAIGCVADYETVDPTKIDLALLDIGLPDGSGLDLLKRIKSARPDARTLVFTVFGDKASVIKAFEAGADGFILKDSDQDEMANAIKAVLDGGAPISARAAAFLLKQYRTTGIGMTASENRPKLSPRELELLQYLARGFSYKESARKMSISPSTISEYASSLYRKLAVNSRSEAVFEAVQNGILDLGQ